MKSLKKYSKSLLVAVFFCLLLTQDAKASEQPSQITLEQKQAILYQIQELLNLIQNLQAKLDAIKGSKQLVVNDNFAVLPPSKVGVDPVTSRDHVLGNLQAPIKMITYSDLDCPFCVRLHETMLPIVDKYSAAGEFAWVVRHFPLEMLHVNATEVAVASECSFRHGGPSAFWDFLDQYFYSTEQEDDLSTLLNDIAVKIKIDKKRFSLCHQNMSELDKVEKDKADAIENGAQGTPWSVLINAKGEVIDTINGALPQDIIEGVIEKALVEN
jgi:protein-disulfide isomerase